MMREIKIHCHKDRKGLRMAYTPTGDDNAIVLQGIRIDCPYCTEPRSLHGKTEKEFLSQVVDGKFFI
ncbi:MAG: hypothetical protein K6F30_06375 [Lachnospiraceae bacterium]|nr:hypothetical protein [Lachnospiraceae bacterium]